MELHITSQLVNECEHRPLLSENYLSRLPLTSEQHAALSVQCGDVSNSVTMATLHRALAAGHVATNITIAPTDLAYGSVAARLQLAYGMPPEAVPATQVPTVEHRTPQITVDASGRTRLHIAPPLKRASMVAHPWGTLNPLVRWIERANRNFDLRSPGQRHHTIQSSEQVSVPSPETATQEQHNSTLRGNVRRIVLLVLMFMQTALATYFMSAVLPYHGTKPLEIVTLGLFALLFCWVSAGFWTAMAGFLVLMRGTDRYVISREDAAPGPIAVDARTAIVMPICNENVGRVYAGLRATYESLASSGELGRFDFFVLSDSSDSDLCAAELDAWIDLCRHVGGFGRIFYRHRRRRVKRKSGNIDDFCRRWGANYRYMIVLDADSVMSGTCLSTLVRLMEANASAGIIQTAPRAAGRDTLYARIQQFSTRVYGPLFTAGLHYWQLGESHYWGHNAIIRLQPFMAHCALAPLPGEGALTGEILSHDFVEAALMRRAGWGVWIAYDLAGSYEEMPPNLLDELKRDRRWCQGNLMNFRLFLARGMHTVHRAVFVTGVMAYLSAPLWFLSLLLSTLLLAMHTLVAPTYFVTPGQLFPIWPEWHPAKALGLFTATATLLFLPKILSVVLICVKGASEFGGKLRLTVSMLIELLFSMLLAPVRMLFHTRFVVAAFLGWAISWKSPPREDAETGWGEAMRRHGGHSVLGVIWGSGVYWLEPSFLWWLLPIVGSLILSIPLSVFSSRVSLGRGFRRARLFVIPEEIDLPSELAATHFYTENGKSLADFNMTVIDPVINALVCASVTARPKLPAAAQAARAALVLSALTEGPDSLSQKQKSALLDDPLMLSQLHFDVWSSDLAHQRWQALITVS